MYMYSHVHMCILLHSGKRVHVQVPYTYVCCMYTTCNSHINVFIYICRELASSLQDIQHDIEVHVWYKHLYLLYNTMEMPVTSWVACDMGPYHMPHMLLHSSVINQSGLTFMPVFESL